MFEILIKFPYFADTTERGDRDEREGDFTDNFIRYHIVKGKGVGKLKKRMLERLPTSYSIWQASGFSKCPPPKAEEQKELRYNRAYHRPIWTRLATWYFWFCPSCKEVRVSKSLIKKTPCCC
jgi:hypothetical protein